MYTAIAGEIMGSTFKDVNHRSQFFELFREDAYFKHNTIIISSVIEIVDWLIKENKINKIDINTLSLLYKSKIFPYINRGFGIGAWQNTIDGNILGYESEGNGALSRLLPLPLLVEKYSIPEYEVFNFAHKLISITHITPNTIKWAEDFLKMLFLLKKEPGNYKEIAKNYADIFKVYITDLERLLVVGGNNVHIPHTMTILLSIMTYCDSQEEMITKTVSLGGDTDTLCALIGGISEYIYGYNKEWQEKALNYFKPADQWILDNVKRLYEK